MKETITMEVVQSGFRGYAWVRWVAFLLGAFVVLSCTSDDLLGQHGLDGVATPPEPKPLASKVPGALRAAYITAVQAGASDEYHAIPMVSGLRIDNRAQGFEATFNQAGVEVAPSRGDGSWTWSMAPVRWGCDGRLMPVPSAQPEGQGHRVDYRREGLSEWYTNGPLGLEQGFTLQTRPCATNDAEVVIELSLGGALQAEVIDGGQAVVLRDPAGNKVLRYTDLWVEDARGRPLLAHLQVDEQRLAIRVNDAGAVYPVVIDPLVWAQQGKLLADDGAPDDWFGTSVALTADTALVGSTLSDVDVNVEQGAAYVFTRDAMGNWTQQAKLVATDGAANDRFGISVALSGDTALVGSNLSDLPPNNAQGAAYVFTRNGMGVWTQQAKLVAQDGLANDQFGISVALSGDTALVGARLDDGIAPDLGSAYVFTRNGMGVWTQQAKLVAQDGAMSDRFGTSVALSGNTALVGAYWDDVGANADQGSAYVFTRNAVGVWTQQAKLIAGDGAGNDRFGNAVALSGDTALIGANLDDVGANTDQGSAYVFTRDAMGNWSQQQKLLPGDGASNDNFGASLALLGDRAIVGAYLDDDMGTNSGSAYVFNRDPMGNWSQQPKLVPSDGAANDGFGFSVALSGDIAVVSAYLDDDMGSQSGSAYHFALVGQPCAMVAECASGYCVDGFCCNTACDDACDVCAAALGATADGVCAPAKAGSLGDPPCVYFCNGTSEACPTSCLSDAGCIDSHYCAADFTCQPKKVQGAFCNPIADCAALNCTGCASGFCVDNFCCDQLCSGVCEGCDGTLKGTCSLVTGPPHGDRICPFDENRCHVPLCDGASRTTCDAIAKDGTLCGVLDCRESSLQLGTCASGECTEGFELPCGGFRCEEAQKACKETCESDDDCAAGYACSNQQCVPATTCESAYDCVPPSVCDFDTKTCVQTDNWAGAQPGCGCAIPARKPASWALWLLALVLSAAILRRRPRRDGRGENDP